MNYIEMAQEIAKEYGIDPDIFARQIQMESRFDPDAVSDKGAAGIAQIMPDTAKKPGFGIAAISLEDRFDPETGLRFGAQYMRAMLDKYDGDYPRALAAYNRGPGKIPLTGKAEFNEESYDYVGNIMDPTAAMNLFNVGDYPVGVNVRDDVQSLEPTIMELLEEQDASSQLTSLLRAYTMLEPEVSEPKSLPTLGSREEINPLRRVGIGSIFE
ncbi:MAG: lytic transglycosylase domain-containing protein [Acidimicrobiales bacterium]